jgi:hypothetical protein
LPEVASGFSADIAEKVRSSWLSEIDTAGAELELLLVALDVAPGALLLLLLLQAAAARHKATDTDATAAPFLATRIIENHLCVLKGSAASRPCDFLAGLADFAALASYQDPRAPEVNVALTSASCREDTVNGDLAQPL